MAKYYLDACIWRDYYENRSDRFRPLGEWALMLINEILENHEIIVVSDMIILELEKEYKPIVIEKMFSVASEKGLVVRINYSISQLQLAMKISKQRKMHFEDVLHAVLARDYNAVLVTRDKHFDELRDIAQIKKPEELI
ncbi:PIN domain-containing protein [Candidatus Woesearchaeota archaeon]|nr:PIN domain-containing protein [Candidatus Woesearchaeota archaeon]